MYGEHKYYDQFLLELTHIHYWNEPFRKRFAIFLPKELTEKEFNNLLFLEKYYDEIFHKYKIEIGGFLFGDNCREDKPRVETYSELEPFIDYASTLVNKSLTRKYKDKKIII